MRTTRLTENGIENVNKEKNAKCIKKIDELIIKLIIHTNVINKLYNIYVIQLMNCQNKVNKTSEGKLT